MRAALWFLALFGIAVAGALFAGNNQGTVTLFWPPYRVDLSLNLTLLALVGAFLLVHFALRAASALFDLPRQASRWRNQQRERAVHAALLDALSQWLAGRYLRARRQAESAAQQVQALAPDAAPPHGPALRAMAWLLAAESSHALQDRAQRDAHVQQALGTARAQGKEALAQTTAEAVLLRAAQWALDDRDPDTALRILGELPQGAARRTLALRLRLRAAQQARQPQLALETARLLLKHRAFSDDAGASIVRGLVLDLLNTMHDAAQLRRAWAGLEASERALPEAAIHAALRLIRLGGDAAVARDWLLPVWERQRELSDVMRSRLLGAIESGLDSLDAAWLARIEAAQMAWPRDAQLQYLAALACMQRQLWGKAQVLMTQAVQGLQETELRRRAWRALARLAQERGDEAAQRHALEQAAGT
ncbi:MAG: hypothetical protein RIQ96_419 [Pseudomonadota bacterium]|jgi:HemY protein